MKDFGNFELSHMCILYKELAFLSKQLVVIVVDSEGVVTQGEN